MTVGFLTLVEIEKAEVTELYSWLTDYMKEIKLSKEKMRGLGTDEEEVILLVLTNHCMLI